MAIQRIIGEHYALVEQIGQGGMGTVYRGIDTQTSQPIAIKLLKLEIIAGNPSLLDRFEREGEALRRLDHPNIVKMLAMVHEGDHHYMVMEYVGGGTLKDLMDEEAPMPVARVLDKALDLADALTRAHRLKIIHRDIKPANVLITEDGTPKLTDFGVAHMESSTQLTETGSIIGTYAYLSPEGCGGSPADERSDIWSFGVMLYEMLTSKNPFDGAYPAQTITNILNKPTPDLLADRPGAPPALAKLITRMLEKDTSQRISSVRQVGAELEAIIRGVDMPVSDSVPDLIQIVRAPEKSRFATPTPDMGEPTATPLVFTPNTGSHVQVVKGHDGTDYVVMPRQAANRVRGLLIFALVALALLIGGGIWFNLPVENGGAVAIATVEPVAAGEYMVLLAQLEPINTPEREVTRFVMDNLKQNLEVDPSFSNIRVRQYPGIITSVEQANAAAETNKAAVMVWGNYTADFVELEIQVGVTEDFPYIKTSRELVERTANVRVRLADERQQSAAPQVLGVLDMLQTADGNGYESLRIAAILESINAASGEVIGDGTAARYQRFFQDLRNPEAFAQLQAAIEGDSGNPLLYSYRSTYYQREGKLEEARLDAISAQRLGPENWSVPFYLLGSNAVSAGNIEEAIGFYNQVVEQRPEDWFPYFVRGVGHYIKREYDQAEIEFDQAIALQPNANLPYSLAMMIALREGRIEDAQKMIDTVLEQFPDPTFAARVTRIIFGDAEIMDVLVGAQTAFGYLALGQHSTVIEETTRALALNSDLLKTELYFMLGVSECSLRDYPASEAAYTKAISSDPDFPLLYLMRAEVHNKQGQPLKALGDLRAARRVAGENIGAELTRQLSANGTQTIGCENVFGLR